MISKRSQRVASLMRREIADILIREFPSKSMVTLTGVRITRDLSIVCLNVSILVDSPVERLEIFKELSSHIPKIRKFLALRVRHQMRSVPQIKFFLDSYEENARRMDELFDQIENQKNSD